MAKKFSRNFFPPQPNTALAKKALISFEYSINLSRSKLTFFLISCSVVIHKSSIYQAWLPKRISKGDISKGGTRS